jgi:membrane protease YdiL (CAAX protease family)
MSTTPSKRLCGRIADFCTHHPLLSYFLLAYAISWAFFVPFVYLWRVVLDGQFEWWLIVFLPGGYGPTIAALVMAGVIGGKQGVKRLLATLLVWRVGWVWYLFAGLLPVALFGVAAFLSSFLGTAAAFEPAKMLSNAPIALLVALPFGPMGEELGWRGFALPRLRERMGPWASTLVLGFAWTFWHLPMFWFPGAAIPSFMELSLGSIALYLAQITAVAGLLTILFEHTRGSVLLAILLHLTFNASENIVFAGLPGMEASQKRTVFILNIVLLSAVAAVGLMVSSRQIRRRT